MDTKLTDTLADTNRLLFHLSGVKMHGFATAVDLQSNPPSSDSACVEDACVSIHSRSSQASRHANTVFLTSCSGPQFTA